MNTHLTFGLRLALPYCLVVFAALANTKQILAQVIPDEVDPDIFVQELFAEQDEDIDYEDLYESLYQYYRKPLNINTVSRNVLQQLFILSEMQLNSFFGYREQFGHLVSIFELQAIPGFDRKTIDRLLQFVTVPNESLTRDPGKFGKRINEADNHFLMLRYRRNLQKSRGYLLAQSTDSLDRARAFQGNPDHLYARYRLSSPGDFSFGLTLEKDAGEAIVFDPSTRRYGADFISFHAALYNRGRLKTLVVGDYRLQVGQGLLLAGGFQIGKGASAVATTRRGTMGILPYTSVLESGFFRGAAATLQQGNLTSTVFLSYQHRAGNLEENTNEDTDQPEVFISSVYLTGLHRNERELERKGNIEESVIGGHLGYQSTNNNLQLGATALLTSFGQPIRRRPNDYNQFEFGGRQLGNIGADFSWRWQNFNLFGEWAMSSGNGQGLITGIVGSLSKDLEVALNYRSYARDFHSFYGAALGESTRNINEQGLYFGFVYNPSRKWALAGYADRFRFPWLRFQADAPSSGEEYLLRLSYRPSRSITVYGQFRVEQKGRNLAGNTSQMDILVNTRRRNWLLNIDYKANEWLQFRTRVQGSDFKQDETTYGVAIVQDVTCKVNQLSVSARYAFFDTDDFNNRQYVYEKDVLYAFSFPVYNGLGLRSYLLAKYKINRQLDVWARYAVTSRRDADSFGSGLDLVEQSIRSEIKLQIRYKFN